MNDISINTTLTEKILTGFIKSELNRVGFTKCVIGLSGGIDSAVSCALAARALGPENVLAIRMPYRTSSQGSLDHAQLLIDQLGIPSKTIPISDMAEAYYNAENVTDPLRMGNVMARCRMIVLYDQSEEFNGLVMGTSNKTEILLGYSTIFGDAACAINPIGDLYKTQLRELARHLEIPDIIISKPPSADLWEGQTDEADLGFTYADVDQLLYLIVDERATPEDCIDQGFTQTFIDQVLKRMRQTHYKRIMPPIAKLSNRTVGYDFLYLRSWGS